MKFRDALIEQYLLDPARVLPNAYWKTMLAIEEMETSIERENGKTTVLEMWDDERLLMFWRPKDIAADFSNLPLDSMKLALIHEDFLSEFPAEQFTQKTGFFRYSHLLKEVEECPLLEGFAFVQIDPQQENEQLADLIDRCYPNMAPSPETILTWAGHRVYQPDLWLWVMDQENDRPAGAGLAEFDPEPGEGSLEWIQVLPEYQGRGLGKAVVLELLRRLKERAGFVTVSGEIENPSNPGGLYRRCGFVGDDHWYVFSR